MPENNDKAVIVSGIFHHLAVRFVFRAVREPFVQFVNGIPDTALRVSREFWPARMSADSAVKPAFFQE
jgi:hypothetical protein